MKILLVDDERPARGELRRIVEALSAEAEIAEAASGGEAVEQLLRDSFDVMFLDMELGDMLGTTVAATAQKLQPGLAVIFATAYDNYAVKAFEIGAADYILKPYDPERIARALGRSCGVKGRARQEIKRLPVNLDKKILLLPLHEVIYIETLDRGSLVHAVGGVYENSASLGSFERKLAGCSFFRIHKSYLVNLDHVETVFPWQGRGYGMTMEGVPGTVLPIGRGQFRVLKPLFQL